MTPADFDAAVTPHRAALHAYCYRMLGSLQDAEDALQETLIDAWRGLGTFQGTGSLRGWLFRVATHASLRVIEKRPKRILPDEYEPASTGVDVEGLIEEPVFLEPYPDAADATYELRESVELAFVAALQHLPATQRATLILREVLGFSAAEVAALLETTVPSINSALQRARESVDARVPPQSQQATRRSLGAEAERELVTAYITAWGAADVDGLVRLLTRDVKFTMPPIPTWFDGLDAVARFFRERVFATPWRLEPIRASGQLAFAGYQGPDFRLGALNVVTLRDGAIATMTGFLHPATHRRFQLPDR